MKLNRVILVSSFIFDGRPEQYITDCLYKKFNSIVPTVLIQDSINYNISSVGNLYNNKEMAIFWSNIVKKVIDIIEDKDILFFVDGWNPGLPIILQYVNACKLDIKIFGIWHSNPIAEGDYLQNNFWAIQYQNHLLKHLDGILVGTESLKKSLGRHGNIFVTGLPINKKAINNNCIKEYAIAFSHRWAKERNPELFLELALWWKLNIKDNLKFVVLTNDKTLYEKLNNNEYITPILNKSKEEYYNNISKVQYIWSNSQREAFGYSIIEAVLSKAIPILNDIDTYRELYPSKFLYKSFEEQVEIITKYRKVEEEYIPINTFHNSEENIVELIKAFI